MHTMQEEDNQSPTQDEIQVNGYLGEAPSRPGKGQRDARSPKLVMAAVGGMLLPLLTQIGHAH